MPSFRQKCLARLDELRSQGTTILFVSHNMYLVRRLCAKALLLVGGQPQFLGGVDDAISAYEKTIATPATGSAVSSAGSIPDTEAALIVTGVTVRDPAGQQCAQLRHYDNVAVRVSLQHPQSGS